MGRGFPQTPSQKAIVPFKGFICLVFLDFHNHEIVNACSTHIRHGCVSGILKMKSLDNIQQQAL
jgi:hypothetical protein